MNNPENNATYGQTIEVPKTILYTGKFLQTISPRLATKFASRLFVSPFRHKMPKREQHMDSQSRQTTHTIPTIGKEIVVYEYGESDKKILLVHGWSGRGTQLVKIADAFLEEGYATVSFDAPAHGKAGGKASNMAEFIEAVMYIDQHYSPFEAAVGHSLGGMALLNAVKKGLKIRNLVTIGSGDMVSDIALDFVRMLQLKDEISYKLKAVFDQKMGYDIDGLSASIAARDVDIPTLVMHDTEDLDVPVSAAKNILKNLSHGELVVTTGLGHRKILGDSEVIQKIITFIKN